MGVFKQAIEADLEKEEMFLLHISRTGCIGIKTYNKMQSFFKSPEAFYNAGMDKLEKTGIFTKQQLFKISKTREEWDVFKDYRDMKTEGIRLICSDEKDYPGKLLHIRDYPPIIFTKGNKLQDEIPLVAVIGARECTDYGANISRRIGELLGERNIGVVSGMARGIDAISQTACLDAGGYSVAFLGGGVDIIYPKESFSLYKQLLNRGCVVSEYPHKTAPQRPFFAQRNRLISALADVVCVVEARDRSGTLITVDAALEQGKEVYAVPGRISDLTSIGTNDLIKQGAFMVTDINEFVDDLASVLHPVSSMCDGESFDKKTCILNQGEEKLLKLLEDNSFTPEQFVKKTGLQAFELLGICATLSAKGLLINSGAGRFKITFEGENLRNRLLTNEMG